MAMFSKPCGLFCKLFSPRGLCSINARPSSSKCIPCRWHKTQPGFFAPHQRRSNGRTNSKCVQSYSFLLLMMSIHREIIVSMKKITQFNKYTVMNATQCQELILFLSCTCTHESLRYKSVDELVLVFRPLISSSTLQHWSLARLQQFENVISRAFRPLYTVNPSYLPSYSEYRFLQLVPL